MSLVEGFQRRLESLRNWWNLFLQVNRQPDVLPAWPSTAMGRLGWDTLNWLARGSALIAGAALGALLGVDAQRGYDVVFQELPGLFGLVAAAVGMSAFVRLTGWFCRFGVHAGRLGVHAKKPRTVVLDDVLTSVFILLLLLGTVSWLTWPEV